MGHARPPVRRKRASQSGRTRRRYPQRHRRKFIELRGMLLERGHKLRSETDTERISHLVEEALKRGLDLAEAVRATVAQLRSSFSIVAITETEPGRLVAAKTATPLVLG